MLSSISEHVQMQYQRLQFPVFMTAILEAVTDSDSDSELFIQTIYNNEIK